MSDFICSVRAINQMLEIVNSIPVPTTKLEVFNNGIKFAFENNLDDWFQLVKCVDGSFDLQLAYENSEGLQVVWLDYGYMKELKEKLKNYIPGLYSPELDENHRKLEDAMKKGNYV